MRKYFVSLAMSVPSNFEIEVFADSEQGALDKALEDYNKGEESKGEITEADWVNSDLDIDEGGVDSAGVHIEEIE